MTAETTRLYVQCHCKQHTFHADVPNSALPLERIMCHCYDCRHITGMMAADCIILPQLAEDVFDEKIGSLPNNLRVYKKQGGIINWYFCQICGTHLVQSAVDSSSSNGKRWVFSTGVTYPLVLEDETKTTKLEKHKFVRNGLDQGGMSQYMPDGLPRYSDSGNTIAPENIRPTQEETKLIEDAMSAPTMPLRCHCGHVQLDVHRPSSKPLPEERNNWATLSTWPWTFCLCHSCRATSGFDANPFMFIFYSHITSRLEATAHPTDGLTSYSSYPGRRRHFCPTCGAKIFFDRSDRGDLCDTFLGTIDIPLASMFQSWLRKGKQLSYACFAKNTDLADCLAQGFCPGEDLSITESDLKEGAKYDGKLQLQE